MSNDLFARAPHAPLAESLRPKTLDEVIGQSHLVGPGKPLRLAFESGTPHSMIFWGPPGVGKTTLARLMADSFDAEFIALSAVFSGVKDIRESMQQAELTQKLNTLLEGVNRGLESHERLQFVAVAREPWAIENGFLTPTMKMRRARIEDHYGALAAGWYATGQAVIWQ